MFNWVYELRLWQVAIIFSGFSVALMWAGIILVKPYFHRLFGEQTDLNSLVGITVSAFSVFYGLLLGLISVAVFQSYSNLSDNVAREASVIAALDREFAAYDAPARQELLSDLRTYVRTTIDVDWPLQRQGIVPSDGSMVVGILYPKLARYEPQRISQQILHAEVLREFNSFIELRRARLANVTSGLPGVLWYVVLGGGVLNVVLFWMFDIRLAVHIILGGLFAFFLGVMIFVIVALDVPFRGKISVSPDPLEAVYGTLMRPEAGRN